MGKRSILSQRGQQSSRWAVLAVLCLALFMALLDTTIVNIAIPDIMTDLGASLSAVEWVLNAYVLAAAVTLITLGRMGDIYGRRLFFIVGLALFTLASALCGLAPHEQMLIAARAVQGLGFAFMLPQTLSIIVVLFRAEERGLALGLWGGVAGLALAIGPALGGLLVSISSWRLIFYLNVPIGALALVAASLLMRESVDPRVTRRIDWPGVVTVTAALFCLTFALIEGQNYGWSSPAILGLFIGAAASFAAFYLIERRQPHALFDLTLLRIRSFSAANGVLLLVVFALVGVLFLLTLFLQYVLGFSALAAGLVITPAPGVVILVAPLTGRLSDRVGVRWLLVSGMAVTAAALFMLTGLRVDTRWQDLMLPLALAGLGLGLTMAPLSSAVMGSVPATKAGNASGIFNTGQQVGSVLGVSVFGAVLQGRIVGNLTTTIATLPLPESLRQTILDRLASGDLGMGDMVSSGLERGSLLGNLIFEQVVRAINTTFFVGAIAALVGALMALLVTSHARKRSQTP